MSQTVIGQTFDNYQITGVLGRGGMGVVYKARNLALDKDVALKVMDLSLAQDEMFLSRFKSEAKSLARLQSPNIVSVYDLRETPLGFCIVMEFVEGRTLADKLRESGAMPQQEAVAVFRQILSALDHAHNVGVIHRDIKPGNIMLTKDGTVKVADFGLAKIQQAPSVTATMMQGGTLRYMSPEQVRGLSAVDRRGDIYSLGMTLYEAIVGKLPFTENDSDYAIRQAIVEGKVPRPDKLNPSLPKGIVRVIMKSIAKDPGDRFQTASEMMEALNGFDQRTTLSGVSAAGTITPLLQTPARAKSRMLIGGTVVAVVAVAGFLLLRLYFSPARAQATILTDPPGAAVELNGVPIGSTPIEHRELSPGSGSFRFILPGFLPHDTLITLEGGTSLTLMVTLLDSSSGGKNVALSSGRRSERPPTMLVLQAVPAGSVSVDGQRKSESTKAAIELQVESGHRTVTFTHPEYGTKTVEVTLQPGETRRVTCYFESYASILARPVWASIVIDGRNTGLVTPQAHVPLGVGMHRITVSRTDFEPIEGTQRVDIYPTTEPRTIPLVFNLERK